MMIEKITCWDYSNLDYSRVEVDLVVRLGRRKAQRMQL
jgi:hypothetical protein